ncbi:retrotransposon protein, putative, ty1-copia subclass [Tanacetum coccineum]
MKGGYPETSSSLVADNGASPPPSSSSYASAKVSFTTMEIVVIDMSSKLSIKLKMSSKNGVNPPAPNPSTNPNFSLLSVLGRERLIGPNYMDWMRNLRFTLRYENKEYVLDEQISTINGDSTQEETEAHQKHYNDAKASKECLDVMKSQMARKPKPGASICAFILEMKGYFDRTLKTKRLKRVVTQGLKENRRLKHGELNLVMGNRKITPVTRIGKYELMLKSEVRIKLNNCYYSSEITRKIILFHALFKDGYKFSFDNENGNILVYSNGCFMFKASPCKGVYETVECISNNGNVILNVGLSNELDKSKLWHSRLGNVNKKRIAQLQKDGVLESFDFKLDDVCESCLLGKMTKSPFTRTCERGEGLLDLVHTDVCRPFRSAIKDGKRYYVTFTDDFSRYRYVYLIKHKSDTFEVFKRYQNEVENQLGRKIKVFRSDEEGEYLSIKFFDHLKNCGIVSQLTPPRTPQLNGVAERRNKPY